MNHHWVLTIINQHGFLPPSATGSAPCWWLLHMTCSTKDTGEKKALLLKRIDAAWIRTKAGADEQLMINLWYLRWLITIVVVDDDT